VSRLRVAGRPKTGGQRLPTGGHSIDTWWGGLTPEKKSCTDGASLQESLLRSEIGWRFDPTRCDTVMGERGLVIRTFCSHDSHASLSSTDLPHSSDQPEIGGHVLSKNTRQDPATGA